MGGGAAITDTAILLPAAAGVSISCINKLRFILVNPFRLRGLQHLLRCYIRDAPSFGIGEYIAPAAGKHRVSFKAENIGLLAEIGRCR